MMQRIIELLVVTVLALAGAQAHAQAYPAKTLRLVVPFPPGGGTDGVARSIHRELGELLGQPVVIENRPGAGGLVAWSQVAKAAPDGHTLVMVANNLRLYKLMQAKLDFDPDADLVAVAPVASVPMVLVGSSNLQRLAGILELAATGRNSPAKLNYGIVGTGSPHHLAYALLSASTGARFTLISYKGTGPLMNDLLGAQIDLAFVGLSVALPHIKSGRLKSFGVAAARRSAIAAEVPTLAEGGGPGFDASYWFAIAVPRGTARTVIERLNAEITKAVALPAVRESFLRQGFEPMAAGVEQTERMFADEIAKWSRPIADYAIRAD